MFLPNALTGCAGVLLATFAVASASVELQSVAFNSSFSLSPAQIKEAQLSDELANQISQIIRFERSQLANGGPMEDDFYSLPPVQNTTALEAGTLLKVQTYTNTIPYSIPPSLALSRILYTTANINGTVVPASGFVLWPFAARDVGQAQGAAPVVLWAHGTAGYSANTAPSAHRALWYGDAAPFALALAGYAVVAPDYAGLGVARSWDGSEIPHQYLMSPAGAQDALYAMQAAREAFPQALTEEFVAFGHSQGGGVAWAVAEAVQADPSLGRGYLGAIAGSPTTDAWAGGASYILPFAIPAFADIFPGFRATDVLSPLGLSRVNLMRQIQGSFGLTQPLLATGGPSLRPGAESNRYVREYSRLGNAGRKDFKGPLLVVQGTADVYVNYNITAATVAATHRLFPEHDLEFLVVQGMGHVPSLDASRSTWLRWIEDRFTERQGSSARQAGYRRREVKGMLAMDRYQKSGNSFTQWAGAPQYQFETPLGP